MKIVTFLLYLIISLCPLTLWAQQSSQETDLHVSRYVNPFIGTSGEAYTYPGAVSPWGMVSASPHTTYATRFDYVLGTIVPTGYRYGDPLIHGFGQTHLSGVACNELGAPVIAVSSGELTPAKHASKYSDEIAKAGFYAVKLTDPNISVEATTTQRAAFYRFTFHNDSKNYLMLDATTNLSWISNHQGSIKKINPQEYTGWSQSGNFCYSGNQQKVYFAIKAFDPSVESGTWQRGGKDINDHTEASGDVGAWFQYNGASTVTVGIGVSYVSAENARENLQTEIADKSFDTVLAENIQRWDKQLGKVVINDRDKIEQKTVFYTALYHALLHPNVVSDVNGDYPLYESKTRATGNNKNYPRYGLFSLWDSYRNVHALLSLLYPEQQQAMLYTLEDMSINAGHPPRWELYGSETNIMVGDPAVSVLAEGMIKGFNFQDPEKLFATLYKSATDTTSTWRAGNAAYWDRGYIPEKTDDVWGSVSTTLEYSYHDWALAQFAEATGNHDEAALLRRQAIRWRGLFDTKTGTVCPHDAKNNCIKNFDPAAMDDSWWVKLVIKNHGGPGFVEGNAYQYTYMVPHDIAGLDVLFGSTHKVGQQLQFIFDNNHFTLWNEPNMSYPYLLAIDPARISNMQTVIQQQRTANFSNSPAGIPGNDDAGVLSAWYVFSALGFYPVNPASGEYAVGIPLFQNVRLKLETSGASLQINTDFDPRTASWRTLSYNQQARSTPSILHSEIVSGGELNFSK